MAHRRVDPIAWITELCRVAADPRLITRTQHRLARDGIARAVREHNTDRLYDWLVIGLAFQGVADRVAWGYIEQHGSPQRAVVRANLVATRCACPKLAGFEAYTGCRYRKGAGTCARPQHLRLCPVRKLDLRKGLLNTQAHALHFWLRDRAGNDLVGFIDRVIEEAIASDAGIISMTETAEGWAQRAQQRLVAEFSAVDGISAKIANMVIGDLLLGARRTDRRWLAVGAETVTVDTLVHKTLDRTGILKAVRAEHAYGPTCYGANGCEQVLRALAAEIDARAHNPAYPARFPRLVQKAVWQLGAQNGLNLCNAAHVGNGRRCAAAKRCPVAGWCTIGTSFNNVAPL